MSEIQELTGAINEKLGAAGLEQLEFSLKSDGDGVRLGFDIGTILAIIGMLPEIMPLILQLIELFKRMRPSNDNGGGGGATFH